MIKYLPGSPVVRIGPNHVHIKDIDTYEKCVHFIYHLKV